MSKHRQGFEDALRKDRYASEVRLIYADWLDENGFYDQASEQRRMATPAWVKADIWMHDFAARCGIANSYDDPSKRPISYEDCIQAGHNYLKNECDYFVQIGSEEARSSMWYENKDFWRNWSTITGVAIDDNLKQGGHGSAPFSCSC